MCLRISLARRLAVCWSERCKFVCATLFLHSILFSSSFSSLFLLPNDIIADRKECIQIAHENLVWSTTSESNTHVYPFFCSVLFAYHSFLSFAFFFITMFRNRIVREYNVVVPFLTFAEPALCVLSSGNTNAPTIERRGKGKW